MLYRDELMRLNSRNVKNLIQSEITNLLTVPRTNRHQELFYLMGGNGVKTLGELVSHMLRYRRTVPMSRSNRNMFNKYLNIARNRYELNLMVTNLRLKPRSHPARRHNKPIRRSL